MGRLKILLQKSKITLKEQGVITFARKTANYIEKSMKKENNSQNPECMFMDVLFINGCFLPHPSRYRVSHQREQLLAYGIASNEVFYENLELDLVKRYRVFIFFRCPYTEMVGKFIEIAKKMNKKVLFDIDDLVIDKKYTDDIPYLKTMSKEEKEGYDNGVTLMRKTLQLCEAAITTTEMMAQELRNYVPTVFINRNVASERMVQLSEAAIYCRDVLAYLEAEKIEKQYKRDASIAKSEMEARKSVVRLGYFSGSITHNDDVAMILPVLVKIMEENPQVELHFVGELDVPEELAPYSYRIINRPFVSWEELPKLIASVDINLAPLHDTIFNAAKSENKWMEAALVKVPTVASNVGAMHRMIENGKTGILCETIDDWYKALTELIVSEDKRHEIAEMAFGYAKKHCVSVYTGYALSEFLKSQMVPNFVIVLPSTQISGGVLVALKHALIMREKGYDVTIFNEGFEESDVEYLGEKLPVISTRKTQIHGIIDKAVATLWTTVNFMRLYPNIKQRYYLVQGFETNFYLPGNFFRISANQTYCIDEIEYVTISKWCKKWLNIDYKRKVKFAPNGIESARFTPIQRNFSSKKIRILIEGNSEDHYKNVDEAFRIVQELSKEKFEIWFMSYQGEPKKWYSVDRFLHRVPYEDIPKVYEQCDILLKTSIFESFSYPPLEMMATGGMVVVAPNDGNVEYLRNEENCLMYPQGDITSAVRAIERICTDEELRCKLYENGVCTAKNRDWGKIAEQIAELYQ